MRLLLILALLFASVTFGQPAAAHDHHEAMQHHADMAQGDHRRHGHEGELDDGKSHAVVHVCPGCALIGQPVVAEAALASAALPGLPANPPSLHSFQDNPIPPPPRPA